MATTKTKKRWKRTRQTLTSTDFGLPNGIKPSQSYLGPVVSWDDTVSYGDGYPDWKQRIKEVRNATTTLVGSRSVLRLRPFEYTYSVPEYRYHVSGTTRYNGVPSSVSTSLEAQALAECKQKFAAKARDKLRTFGGGVAAAELYETVRMLASPTKRLRKEVDSLLQQLLQIKKQERRLVRGVLQSPRGNGRTLLEGRHLTSVRNAIADTWLEWSFGVKPLLSDIQDAYKALQQIQNGERRESIKIKATVEKKSHVFGTTPVSPDLIPGIPHYMRGYEDDISTCQVTIRAAWRLDGAGDIPIPTIVGVDLSSLAPTVWEAIPWSFLVDYFTDVGSAIDACSVRLVNFGWCNYTVRNSREYRLGRLHALHVQGASVTVFCPFGYVASGRKYTVTRHRDLPEISPYIPNLQLPGLGSPKWLNIAALLNGIAALKRG